MGGGELAADSKARFDAGYQKRVPEIAATRPVCPNKGGHDVRKILLTFIIAVVPTSFALAQHAGTSQEQRSCNRDASHFCRKDLGDDWAVQQCLLQHRNQLSRACSKTLEGHGM